VAYASVAITAKVSESLHRRQVGVNTIFAGDVVPLQFERYLILRQTFRLLQAENFGAPGNPRHPWALG